MSFLKNFTKKLGNEWSWWDRDLNLDRQHENPTLYPLHHKATHDEIKGEKLLIISTLVLVIFVISMSRAFGICCSCLWGRFFRKIRYQGGVMFLCDVPYF